MTIVENLYKQAINLRKERNPIAASITFVIAEINKVGKNAGNRITTEDEAIKTVQKIVATLRDNLNYRLTEVDDERTRQQIVILESVLPQMVTEDVVRATIATLANTTEFTKGSVMKALKSKFGALVDMKTVNNILIEYNL
jgi:uncharacterized protein YqeY